MKGKAGAVAVAAAWIGTLAVMADAVVVVLVAWTGTDLLVVVTWTGTGTVVVVVAAAWTGAAIADVLETL